MMEFNAHDLKRARAAVKEAVRQHLFDPNVNLIDIGYRIQERDEGSLAPEVTLRFHLHKKLRGPQFESFAAKQPERVIPVTLGGFPTDVIQSSYHLSLLTATAQPRPRLIGNPRASLMNPMRGGISLSDAFAYGYGTLGGWVRDRATGDEMLLSNFHVLAGSGFARPGAAVLQPGRGDGGRQTVATFVRHGMARGVDAAVARLNDSRIPTTEQFQIGDVTGVVEPQLGQGLIKSGRASGVTRGLVTAIEGVVKLRYGASGERLIRHVCHIVPLTPGSQVSAPGDSGSFWLDADSHAAVGLHFAGADRPEYALAINMAQVEAALGVDVVVV
jgi:endonuclease G, mitochondrial